MQFNPFSLDGKTIVITGATGGIGSQCALDCSRMGAKVVLMGRNAERLQNLLKLCDNAIAKQFDLTMLEQIPPLVDEVVAECGPIHGVVHCAGISSVLPLKLIRQEEMERFFRTNVAAAIILTREICKMRHYSKEGASVVFISSIMGCVGECAKSLYSMTKGALISATRSLACEFGKKNIRFNCISPGTIITDINRNQPYMEDPDKRREMESKYPLGLGETTDISNACIYLLSDAARWVTGQNLIVDGGYTAL
ncbi:MAG: SDR family oxidoreductase [Prevotellaceae bacterium]|nr:SDR family oxidoreductase [Prevotellaceae bacterium]